MFILVYVAHWPVLSEHSLSWFLKMSWGRGLKEDEQNSTSKKHIYLGQRKGLVGP